MGITATLTSGNGSYTCTMTMANLPVAPTSALPPGGVQAPGIILGNSAMPVTVAIVNATNASPIQVTTAVPHGLQTNQSGIFIAGVLGNLATNGTWMVTVVDSLNVTLRNASGNSTGSGAYTSGGVLAYQVSSPIPLQQAAAPLITSFNPPTGVGATPQQAALAAAVALYGLTGGSTGLAGVSAASGVVTVFGQS